MKQRIVTGAIFAVFMLAVIALSHTPVFVAAFSLLCTFAAWEMLKCIGAEKKLHFVLPSLLFALGLASTSVFFRYGFICTITFTYMFVMLFTMVFMHEKTELSETLTVFGLITYVVLSFTCIIKLRYVTADAGANTGDNIGQYLYLLIFIAAWITDTFAYFTGFLFGKHKLCPKISPKKTIEGSIGGTLFCVLSFIVYGIVISEMFHITANYVGLAVVGALMSVISQIGDLTASVIKRNFGIKDYGKLFPGHGGVVDRFDSILPLAPFLLVLCEDAMFVNFLFYV